MLLKKKEMSKYITDSIEISSDSDEKMSGKENFDEENSDEENSNEGNQKIFFINFFFIYTKW